MELGDLIEVLQAEDPAKVCPDGFATPHSWRGDYYELAFDPAQNVTVASMLAHARSAVGATYEGWKGGDYTMDLDSDCYLAEPRDLGETLGPTLLRLMLAAGSVPAPAPEPTEAPERCPSCDHLIEGHQEDGCWYTVTDTAVITDAICPCTWPHGKPAEQDGEQAEDGR